MVRDFDVFISAKGLDEAGNPTEDRQLADSLWEHLTQAGLRVFWSNVTLERMGVSLYSEAIDDALDRARVLVVVCTSSAYLKSKWVRYEWRTFQEDILSGLRSDCHVFVYLAGERIENLPRGLRHTQCVMHGPEGFEQLRRFVTNAIGMVPAESLHHTLASAATARCETTLALAGEWEGEWRRTTGHILHRGRLLMKQSGARLSAEMKVTFEKRAVQTVLTERLHGLVTNRCVVLQGETVEYNQRGVSTSYLFDHFELQPDAGGLVLAGEFYSKKGRGGASFRRI